ncbi:MAG: RelA/SpoT family protein [Bacteroidales bacterium]|nr:RelA/SpoT family protein [Bacteroidales bacterium]
MDNLERADELKIVTSYYREIQGILKERGIEHQRRADVSKAFRIALNAHKDMRRRSGEPYIIHPLNVALIVLKRMNLGATSVICALLHDVVEDTDYTLDTIEEIFGQEIKEIIDGLTKIDTVPDHDQSQQFETFHKILFSMSKDPRVILIKLADRLHNMQTLSSMPEEKRKKTAAETTYFYAPLAHRLGFFSIKSELEDLAMKYQDPGGYEFIEDKIKNTEAERSTFIEEFIAPIKASLEKKGFHFEISSRIKSIYSIWQKMDKKRIRFEEVYDLFAIRIVIDVPQEHENSTCWTVFSTVTDIYQPDYSRLRDWITNPKANGYKALHITVISQTGRKVEVQIRSSQMDKIAENGFAAHWIYKTDENQQNKPDEQGVEKWLAEIKEKLQTSENIGDQIGVMKNDFYTTEISVFTTSGAVVKMPKHSTVIDFAYRTNSTLGDYCIGAKINNRLVPLHEELKSGDQIEIITSQKQKVQPQWRKYAHVVESISGIEKALEREENAKIETGKVNLKDLMNKNHIDPTVENVEKLMNFVDCKDLNALYLAIYNEKITEQHIKKCFSVWRAFYKITYILKPLWRLIKSFFGFFLVDNITTRLSNSNPSKVLLGENVQDIKRTIAPCCQPVSGDPIIAFAHSDKEIVIHRSNCRKAQKEAAKFGNRIIKAKWRANEDYAEFLAGINIQGADIKGIASEIISIIYKDFQINCRSLNFRTSEGIFEGEITLYIKNVKNLTQLIDKLRRLDGVTKVERINSYYDQSKKTEN